jgi:hypothetical protein
MHRRDFGHRAGTVLEKVSPRNALNGLSNRRCHS